MNFKIPVYRPSLDGNEKKYVNDCLDSSWISSKGKYVELFESSFAKYIGSKHAASVCNGTVAIHLALIALGIGSGDEVIVPTLTYIASVNPVIYTGATPIFVDSLNSSWQMNPDEIRKKITAKTKAIIAVHLYGHPCNMQELTQIAKDYNIFLIEDCAEAIGSRYKGKHVGTFGDIATFSFFGNKSITTGEGGMVVTDDQTLYNRIVQYKGQGLAKHREYWHDVIGYNYRMTNICAAIGLAQLEQVDKFLFRKKEIANIYSEGFKSLDVEFHKCHPDVEHSYWMCSVLVSCAEMREPLREHLMKAGIETRPLFYPVHTMPMYATKFQRYVVAESLGWRGINLPSYPTMSDIEVNEVITAVKKFYE
jgi:perosamine synthetase